MVQPAEQGLASELLEFEATSEQRPDVLLVILGSQVGIHPGKCTLLKQPRKDNIHVLFAVEDKRHPPQQAGRHIQTPADSAGLSPRIYRPTICFASGLDSLHSSSDLSVSNPSLVEGLSLLRWLHNRCVNEMSGLADLHKHCWILWVNLQYSDNMQLVLALGLPSAGSVGSVKQT